MILDSTFLIDVLRGEGTVEELLGEVDGSGPPFVTSVTVMELYEGIYLAESTERERAVVEEMLDGINEIPFDRACAKRAGQINAELVASGQPVDETDVMIAATAIDYDLPVVTRNTSHFERIEALEVVSY
ncbi:type II toxin-antitoxin system VapC family toxin [Salinarchaeum chitinilyticum]